jgi:flagellar basal-body rod protein FlgF
MDNIAYIALSRQITLQRELDITANNMANMNTNGYKFEQLMINALSARPAINDPIKAPATFAHDNGIGRDFSQGALTLTGNDFDLGLDGDGAFFVVDGPDGPLYTRNGSFSVDDTGTLRTQEGLAVQSAGGGAIVIDPAKGAPVISQTGVISQAANGASEIVANLNVVRINDLSTLEKIGDTQYRLKSGAPVPALDAKVHQGMLEGSNVNAMIEVTRLIEINRAYTRMASLIEQNQQLKRNAVAQLGQVA